MVWSGNVRKEKCLVQFRDVKECHGIWRKGREVCLKRSGKDKCVMVNVLTVCLASLPCYLLQHSGLRRKFKCIAVRLKSVHSGFFRNHIMDFLISITVADFFFFFFFLIRIHSMQGWTAPTRHGVTRKEAQKRLHDTENLFRKYLQFKDVC